MLTAIQPFGEHHGTVCKYHGLPKGFFRPFVCFKGLVSPSVKGDGFSGLVSEPVGGSGFVSESVGGSGFTSNGLSRPLVILSFEVFSATERLAFASRFFSLPN